MTKPSPPDAPPAPARQPTLRQLRGFKEVARHASFSRAAQALALSQPALSAAIRELEALMGVALFERSTHHVRLTPAGYEAQAAAHVAHAENERRILAGLSHSHLEGLRAGLEALASDLGDIVAEH